MLQTTNVGAESSSAGSYRQGRHRYFRRQRCARRRSNRDVGRRRRRSEVARCASLESDLPVGMMRGITVSGRHRSRWRRRQRSRICMTGFKNDDAWRVFGTSGRTVRVGRRFCCCDCCCLRRSVQQHRRRRQTVDILRIEPRRRSNDYTSVSAVCAGTRGGTLLNVGRSTFRTINHRCRQRRDRRPVVEAGSSQQCRDESDVGRQTGDFAGQRGDLVAESIESTAGLRQFMFDYRYIGWRR